MELITPSRNSRLVGLVVMLFAVLAIVAAPSITGRPTAGAPIRTVEPLVGDCVRMAIPWGANGSDSDRSGSDRSASDGDLARPTGVPVGCREPGAARVIARTPTLDLPDRLDQHTYAALTQSCEAPLGALVDRWQGGVFRWTRPGAPLVMKAQFMVTARAVGPTPEAVGHGERWTACVLTGIDGRTGEALAGSVPNPSWGLCFTDLGGPGSGGGTSAASGRTVTPCAEPHTEQWIGAGTSATYPSQDVIGDSRGICRVFLEQVTGLDDVTAGGALEVFAQPQEYGGIGSCGLRVTERGRTLSGSLIGLRNGSVPWT